MEFVRRALNPWGQDVLIGVSWDLIWAAVAVGAIFVVAHALLVPKKLPTGEIDPAEAARVPDRIQRHSVGARAFHWSMSVAMLVLLVTAFFPLIGIQFPWVTIHWIAGVGLIVTVIYHIVHVFTKQDFWTMWIDRRDVEEGTLGLKKALRMSDQGRPRAGKYPADQKLFHHAATITGLGAILTGVLMMFRVENPLLGLNPYLFGDSAWGWIYVIHGLSGIGLIVLVISHIYFAIRPEKRWMTWSMINGWIDRESYLANHDPARWKIGEEAPAGRLDEPPSGVGGLDRAVVQDKMD